MAPDVTYFDPTREKRVDGLAAVKAYMLPSTGKIRIDSYEMINPQIQSDGNVVILTFNLIRGKLIPKAELEQMLATVEAIANGK